MNLVELKTVARLYVGKHIDHMWRISKVFAGKPSVLVRDLLPSYRIEQDVTLDLRGLKPSDVRDFVRKAERLGKIVNANLRWQLECKLTDCMNNSKHQLDFFYLGRKEAQTIIDELRGIGDFVKKFQFESVSREYARILESVEEKSNKWAKRQLSAPEFPQLAENIRSHFTGSTLAPAEITWLFETPGCGFLSKRTGGGNLSVLGELSQKARGCTARNPMWIKIERSLDCPSVFRVYIGSVVGGRSLGGSDFAAGSNPFAVFDLSKIVFEENGGCA